MLAIAGLEVMASREADAFDRAIDLRITRL
jgi:hypothetical protein